MNTKHQLTNKRAIVDTTLSLHGEFTYGIHSYSSSSSVLEISNGKATVQLYISNDADELLNFSDAMLNLSERAERFVDEIEERKVNF